MHCIHVLDLEGKHENINLLSIFGVYFFGVLRLPPFNDCMHRSEEVFANT